jgi:hypothetical protein
VVVVLASLDKALAELVAREELVFLATLKVVAVAAVELLEPLLEEAMGVQAVHMAGAKAGKAPIQPQVAVLYVSCGPATHVHSHQLVLAHLNF